LKLLLVHQGRSSSLYVLKETVAEARTRNGDVDAVGVEESVVSIVLVEDLNLLSHEAALVDDLGYFFNEDCDVLDLG
jgi:hypothetical protein